MVMRSASRPSDPVVPVSVKTPATSRWQHFWQSPAAQNLVPLVSSLGLHLRILALGWATYIAVATIPRSVAEPMPEVGTPVMMDELPPMGEAGTFRGLGEDPSKQTLQDKDPTIP